MYLHIGWPFILQSMKLSAFFKYISLLPHYNWGGKIHCKSSREQIMKPTPASSVWIPLLLPRKNAVLEHAMNKSAAVSLDPQHQHLQCSFKWKRFSNCEWGDYEFAEESTASTSCSPYLLVRYAESHYHSLWTRNLTRAIWLLYLHF